MDGLYDPDTFQVTFPLWMLVHPVKKAEGFITINGAGGEVATPLFTDRDLVDRFQQENPPLKHYALAMMENPAKVLPLLGILEKRGFTHVTMDHTKRGAMFFPIAQLRSAIESAGNQQEG
jgi:hypothetical protein